MPNGQAWKGEIIIRVSSTGNTTGLSEDNVLVCFSKRFVREDFSNIKRQASSEIDCSHHIIAGHWMHCGLI